MAELADALVLGSSVLDVQVQVLLAAPYAKSSTVKVVLGCTAFYVYDYSVSGTTPYSSTVTGSA